MPIIKMDPELMMEMKASFQKGAEDLDDTLYQMQEVATLLEEGGLIGQGGDAYVEGLRSVLARKIVELRDKFEEMGRDIQHAVESMEDADTAAGNEMGL